MLIFDLGRVIEVGVLLLMIRLLTGRDTQSSMSLLCADFFLYPLAFVRLSRFLREKCCVQSKPLIVFGFKVAINIGKNMATGF